MKVAKKWVFILQTVTFSVFWSAAILAASSGQDAFMPRDRRAPTKNRKRDRSEYKLAKRNRKQQTVTP